MQSSIHYLQIALTRLAVFDSRQQFAQDRSPDADHMAGTAGLFDSLVHTAATKDTIRDRIRIEQLAFHGINSSIFLRCSSHCESS